MLGVILAGGHGKRLKSVSGSLPKYFLDIYGEPLIGYPIKSMERAGIDRFLIVVNRLYIDEMEKIIGDNYPHLDISIIPNDIIDGGNGTSLLASISEVGDEYFIVSMADHIYSHEIISRLVSDDGLDECLIAGDRRPIYTDLREATKIWEADQLVYMLGKDLNNFSFIDVGVFRFSRRPLKRLLSEGYSSELTVTDVVNWLIRNEYRVRVVDCTGISWTDIDTPSDYWDIISGWKRHILKDIFGVSAWNGEGGRW